MSALLVAGCIKSSQSSLESVTVPEGLIVEAFESKTVGMRSNASVEFVLDTPSIPIRALTVQTIGLSKEVKIDVASLSGQPAHLEVPPAFIYQYLHIGYGNLGDSVISSASITFEVERSWINSHGLDDEDVALERHSGDWTLLPTRLIGSDSVRVR